MPKKLVCNIHTCAHKRNKKKQKFIKCKTSVTVTVVTSTHYTVNHKKRDILFLTIYNFS